MAEYYLGRFPCDLQDTGIRIGTKSYGFAIHKKPKNATEKFNLEELDKATLYLIETGEVERLKSM